MTDEKITSDHRDYIAALATGLDVLGAFDAQHRSMTLSQVAERLNIDRAKARRFLLTLHALGYIQRDGRLFALTPKVLSLAHAYTVGDDYLAVVEHYLKEVTQTLGESASLGKLEGQHVVYVARSPAAHRLMSINITTGTRLPAAYTSMGRVLVAGLDSSEQAAWLDGVVLSPHTRTSIIEKDVLKEALEQSRGEGFSIVDQELEEGLRSIAVPVFSGKGELIGAMNISTNASRVSMEHLTETCLPVLQQAAAKIKDDTR
ncbi:helix-turn-helix domain-containing protein [Alteromonas sp. NFXS44]|uniref:IclR family transcriptional regulator domain-containing protein n=1 Tax=Alteromonas sp. NFXS44 TaxID=2818435 RepID=UPI0032DFFC46